ncbi:tocopherol chloroplastic q6k7v6 [Nannochloropsis oceanica]
MYWQSHPILFPFLFLLAFLALLPTPSSSSAWDPHPWPSTPPYVEGWYVRLTSLDTSDTLGVIFGASLLPLSPPSSLPPCYVAILHGDGKTNKTTVYEGNPPLESVEIRGHYGRNITKSPDWRTEPHFTWRARTPSHHNSDNLTADTEAIKQEINNMMLSSSSSSSSLSSSSSSPFTTMTAVQEGPLLFLHITLPTARFLAQIEVSPWAYDGSPRPHSWTDIIDEVPLHWYIHTLSSRLLYARLELHQAEGAREGGKVMESRHGLVHLEKNWGKRFPDSWLWAQGVTAAPSSHASSSSLPSSVAFVLSYGQVSPGIFTHFAHFRDEELGIAWDFKPVNSVLVAEEVDGCEGRARFVLEGWGEEEGGREEEERKRMMRGAAPGAMAEKREEEEEEEEEEEKKGGSGPGKIVASALFPPSPLTPRRRRLVLELTFPLGSAACLSGPTGKGFEKLCQESFQGEARLIASVMKGGGREEVAREVIMERIAFELGGTMRCEGKCENEGK